MAKLGALVIGQSPRPDLEAEIRAVIGPDIEIQLRGVLDGLSRSEIDGITPESNADTLFTRLPNGDGVRISKKAVTTLGEDKLSEMVAIGYDVVIVMCTGEFPSWLGRFNVVFPSRVIAAFAAALHNDGRLGVFTPLPEQAPHTLARWQKAGYETIVEPLSPNANSDEMELAAANMARAKPSLMVFDCISYTRATKQTICGIVQAPGILGASAAARAAGELVG